METGTKISDVVARLDEAERCFNQGRIGDAGRICDRILVEDPDDVRALIILGGCLARTGKTSQAIQVTERVCILRPGDAVSYSNLSYLNSVAGNVPRAVLAMAHAVICDTSITTYQSKFAQLTDHLEFYELAAETAVIREAIRICLSNPGIDAGLFSTAWHSLLLLEPEYTKYAAITREGGFEQQAEQVNIEELAKPLADPFLLLGLSSLHAMDARLEGILTFFRQLFISQFDGYDLESFLPFLCALAEHCNLNEYVYGCTEKEQGMVEALESTLDLPVDTNVNTETRIVLIACYKDLMHLDCADRIEDVSSGSQSEAFKLFVRNTISTPKKIRACHETISALSSQLGSAHHAVSSAVAKQYEENPYPRWRHLDVPVLNEKQRAKGRGKNILIAGCGTGHELLVMATRYPEARILGIDLSVPSLAYGKQKAVEFGIDNVEFLQADILHLDALGQQFDLITCSGVLHHMEDPVEGWRKLLTRLKPDGLMKVALYSELARQPVVLCRDWIEEQGFASTPGGIREFRQAILDMDDENPLKDIVNWTDFFSLSMCRDLVFHVQEHRVTLPWIKSALDDLHLRCLFMRMSNPFFKKEYLSMFPGDQRLTDLDKLHEYEKHNPATFRDMYQFMCCRKGSVSAKRPPSWFYTAGL